MDELIIMTEDRDRWRKYVVDGVANPRIENRLVLTLPDLSLSLTCSLVTPFCRISYRASSSQSIHASSTVSSSSTSVNCESMLDVS